jgi:hypothetical protein
MNKLHLQPPRAYQENVESIVSTLPPDSVYPALEASRRLVVLVPTEADDTAAMRRIWELAHTLNSQILFLGLCSNEAQESSLRRQLITLCAMAQDGKIQAEGRIETGSNWIPIVRSTVRDGDMIVCFDEQNAGLGRRPLSQVLESSLRTPVYILSDLSPQARTLSSWLSGLAAWAGLAAIVAGVFLIQIQIVNVTVGWLQTILLIGSVLAELWLIWIWNRLFR